MKGVGLYAYKAGSASAKALAEAMNIPRIKHKDSKFDPRGKFILNWGSTETPGFLGNSMGIYNFPSDLAIMGNKLRAFQRFQMHGVHIPPFCVEREEAIQHMRETNCHMMARTVLTGHSGNGIVFCESPDDLPEAPLYTQYIKKAAEYRVHFIHTGGKVRRDTIPYFVQRKARRTDVDKENVNWKVRNREGGFIYANDPANVGEVPKAVMTQAWYAFAASRLSFAAVDVIFNKKKGEAFVLEINTAPGLEGRTLDFYVENLSNLFENLKARSGV